MKGKIKAKIKIKRELKLEPLSTLKRQSVSGYPVRSAKTEIEFVV